MHLPGVASYRLHPGGGEVTAIPDPTAGSQRVASDYERTVLPMALQFAGREVLHASGILAPQGAVAFCAVSMTGKSTLAHEFSLRGYSLWADDAVASTPRAGWSRPSRYRSSPTFGLQARPRAHRRPLQCRTLQRPRPPMSRSRPCAYWTATSR
jgi:hypothetical protein